jgi:hypothetical protein
MHRTVSPGNADGVPSASASVSKPKSRNTSIVR